MTLITELSGDSLSRILLYLQEVTLEYEQTIPDWRSSDIDIDLMNSVRAKLAAAESLLVPPTFTEQESLFLQSILIEFQRIKSDWLRTLPSFNMTLKAIESVGGNETYTPSTSSTPISTYTNASRLKVPPAATVETTATEEL